MVWQKIYTSTQWVREKTVLPRWQRSKDSLIDMFFLLQLKKHPLEGKVAEQFAGLPSPILVASSCARSGSRATAFCCGARISTGLVDHLHLYAAGEVWTISAQGSGVLSVRRSATGLQQRSKAFRTEASKSCWSKASCSSWASYNLGPC